MAPPKRSNRYLAWQALCPDTNGPHQSNPCDCGAYDRSQPFALIQRRSTNVPTDKEIVNLCSDEEDDDDRNTNPPVAKTNLGPAQYGRAAYALTKSNLARQSTGSANVGRFVSTKLKKKSRPAAQYPNHLQIEEAISPQDTLATERHAPPTQRQPIPSPNKASRARNIAIRRDASRRRADQRPSANDPPPAAINNLSYIPPKPKEAHQRVTIQFWAWDYVLRTGDRKEGKSLQRYGNENLMLIRNIKRKHRHRSVAI